jgi:hypothetical protein
MRRAALFLVAGITLLVAAEAQATTPFARRSIAHARVDAARELASVRLPQGAKKVRSDPSVGRLLAPQQVGCVKKFVVEDGRYWRVPGQPASVWSWMRQHPVQSGEIGFGTGGERDIPIWLVMFLFPDQRDVTYRMIYIQLAPARGGGTAIRVDAIAVGEPRPHRALCDTAP